MAQDTRKVECSASVRVAKSIVAILRSARLEYPAVRMCAIDIAAGVKTDMVEELWTAVTAELRQREEEAEVAYLASNRRFVRRLRNFEKKSKSRK